MLDMLFQNLIENDNIVNINTNKIKQSIITK